MADLSSLQNKFGGVFYPQSAQGMSDIVQFFIADAGNFFLTIDDGACKIHHGESDDPSVSISMDTETLLDISSGKYSGMQAFLFGKVTATGDQRLAAKMDSLFVYE